VAASPSLWWNERNLFEQLPQLNKRFAEPGTQARLLLSVGSLEEPVITEGNPNPRQRLMQQRRRISNLNELFAALQPLRSLGLESAQMMLPGADHGGSAAQASLRVLDFARDQP
tara:strand:+ start:11935 stop:12276 length:342 start_codon:yes stop_codon:yes gene_type:complete